MVQCLSPATEAGRRGSLTPAEEPASEGGTWSWDWKNRSGFSRGTRYLGGFQSKGTVQLKGEHARCGSSSTRVFMSEGVL